MKNLADFRNELFFNDIEFEKSESECKFHWFHYDDFKVYRFVGGFSRALISLISSRPNFVVGW